VLKARTFLVIFCLGSFWGFSSCEAVETVSVPTSVERYGLFSAEFRIEHVGGDPDDPLNVDLSITFISPSGEKTSVPAFWRGNEISRKTSLWEVRFAPEEQGEYFFSAELRLPAKNILRRSDKLSFISAHSENKGFLGRSPNNTNYLRFDQGVPFFGIGHNLAWVHNSRPEVFKRYFGLLKKSGCNICRVWICDWSFPLESGKMGYYNRESSERLDKILELAHENGIYIILCLDTYGSLMTESGMWGEGRWDVNPYNSKNGGPCGSHDEFFTEPSAVRKYKNKLRYIVARWGYSTNILAFELMNEYNAPRDWTREMASYIKETGRSERLVTTSLGYPHDKTFDEALIWGIEEIDIVTSHIYGNGVDAGLVNLLLQKSLEMREMYSKPFVVSEFGIDSSKDDKYYDQRGEGTALHNSIWASALSGSFSTAMNWWHDTYIRPKNLYGHYSALSKFLEGIDWDSGEVRFPDVSLVFYRSGRPDYAPGRDVSIRPIDKWGKAAISEFTVLGNGELAGGGVPFKYLHGSEKKDIRVDQVYKVEYKREGNFVIRVGTVSQLGHLNVYMDGVKVLDKAYPAGKGKGPWKKSRFVPEHNIYQCVYGEEVSFNVPKGKHEIKLSNAGKDWIGIEEVILKEYVSPDTANARCLALNVGGTHLFWIHNISSNWRTEYSREKPDEIKDVYFEAYGLAEKSYEQEIWDTREGRKISSKKVKPSGGKVRIFLKELSSDVACKLIPSSH
jgi:hypothetical protein